MNKKFLKTAIVSVCAACAAISAFSLTACGGGEVKAQSYYNKTITFTGKAYTYGFDTVGQTDNYNNGKCDGNGESDTTQRRILEKYWDVIDWKEAGFDTAPKDSDEVKTFIDTAQTKVFEDLAGLSFTVTKTDTVTLTVNMNDKLGDFGGWGKTITMPLCENGAELHLEGRDYTLEEGYNGVGVQEKGNDRLVVQVWMTPSYADVGGKKNVYKDSVNFSMHWETKFTNGYGYTPIMHIDTLFDGSGNFKAKPVPTTDGGEFVATVLSVHLDPEITITDAE